MRPLARKSVLPLTLIVLGAGVVAGYATEDGGHGRTRTASRTPGDREPGAAAADEGSAYTPRRTEQDARIGTIFAKDDTGDHFCTASVVQSPGRNMLITAAHCAFDPDSGAPTDDLVFAPGYRDGEEPTGLWKVRKVVVDHRWADSDDEDLDVAFLVLEAKEGKQIQDVLGGNTLGINRGFHNEVTITGYPSSRDTPITCRNRTTKFSNTQMRIHCTDFEGGTSGSPWIADYDTKSRTGTVIGVLGGHQGGGDEDDVSYAVYFDEDIAKLYRRAQQED